MHALKYGVNHYANSAYDFHYQKQDTENVPNSQTAQLVTQSAQQMRTKRIANRYIIASSSNASHKLLTRLAYSRTSRANMQYLLATIAFLCIMSELLWIETKARILIIRNNNTERHSHVMRRETLCCDSDSARVKCIPMQTSAYHRVRKKKTIHDKEGDWQCQIAHTLVRAYICWAFLFFALCFFLLHPILFLLLYLSINASNPLCPLHVSFIS